MPSKMTRPIGTAFAEYPVAKHTTELLQDAAADAVSTASDKMFGAGFAQMLKEHPGGRVRVEIQVIPE